MTIDAFFVPNVSLMGEGCLASLPERVKMLKGKKPLLVSDKGMTDLGYTARVTELLKSEGIDCAVYDGTVPNPTDHNVEEGTEIYSKENCDLLISLGGGSSHDCCKGIGILVTNGGKIQDYEGLDQLKAALPPFIAINTTAGTASEMTRFTIITNSSNHVKMAIVDWRVTPDVAINDPELMVDMPPSLTAATGMDALTHAVEAYVSTDATPITDACALQAIRLIGQYLRKAVARGDDMEARDKMAYAEYLAGMAFNNAGLGYVHAMSHQLGGFYNLPHGVCNALLLPHVCRVNLMARTERFADIADALGQVTDGLSERDAAYLAIEAIEALSKDVGIPQTLSELGVKDEDIPTMVGNAQKDVCCLTNPRKLKDDEVAAIYKAAL
ncbi:iron-containing alcohol dehydrogenase [Microbulbifer thermotolerans]|uniref:L-threonine dehydrogenase n=1 Tax=Microbulbifer thermotolerans TaxID=252514 RepID=A0A143HID4_MICTH|nr:iron-containing alcohol dehydrogenase [Microbulbifer thermotolerans]AMX01479.1 L-threonine dehydrogenase [Microbulbifer thermotolerans]MCX2778323.1 iron-containing alcohol dehydrogenase [Microbulbifer thermotolerans]MCX2796116.1 iron-containing alcohol dehydrogenase [Microbulbifer thermotolerans]MCX2804362.1 iron-containing alcohol dehydrogenase [Microbulbifer thermotolerans]MCX2834054.1 iron-containing alcohol dehydrogenase [Microbulbifer thermotolerans]